jgi:RimJ/RimL family protein N-acetyltransferase
VNPILIDVPTPIRTPRLLIREARPGDGAEVHRAIEESFAELYPWIPWAEKMPTPEESEANVRLAYARWILREDLRLHVYDSSGRRLLGSTGLHRMNWKIPCFEIGYWGRTPDAGHGYITEATNALTRFAFEALGAKRVELRCDSENVKSSRVAQRLGYVLEGSLRANTLMRGSDSPRDTSLFARTDLVGLPPLEVSWGSAE